MGSRAWLCGWEEMPRGSPLSLALLTPVWGARGHVRLLLAISKYRWFSWDKQKSQAAGVSGVRMEVYMSAGVSDGSGYGLMGLLVVIGVIKVFL